jgi:hypothetical protein
MAHGPGPIPPVSVLRIGGTGFESAVPGSCAKELQTDLRNALARLIDAAVRDFTERKDIEMAKTRAEHVKWCKQRAWEAYNYGKKEDEVAARADAVASMISDLGKSAFTESMVMLAVGLGSTVVDEQSLKHYINGFAE